MKLLTFHPLRHESAPPGGVLRNSWPVGRRTVTVVQDVFAGRGAGMLRTEWDPDLPRKLSKAEWRQYRAGRAAHHQQLANILGAAVA